MSLKVVGMKKQHNPNRAKYYKIMKHCKACKRTYNQVQWYKHKNTKKHIKNSNKMLDLIKEENKVGGSYNESPI